MGKTFGNVPPTPRSSRTLVPVTFWFASPRAPQAARVSVLGPFNGWSPNVHAMRKAPGGGYWSITVYLNPGGSYTASMLTGVSFVDP